MRDRHVIENLDLIEETVRSAVGRNVDAGAASGGYQLYFRYYWRDAVLGKLEPSHVAPAEVGVLIEAIAPTQALASNVLSLARSSYLHCPFPTRKATAGNLAFPFSPSDYEGGDVYEFSVYHLMDVEDENALFPVEMRACSNLPVPQQHRRARSPSDQEKVCADARVQVRQDGSW